MTQQRQGGKIQPARSGRTLKFPLIYMILVGFISFVSFPGGILLVGGMMPAIATWVSDRLPGKPFGMCVGLMNLGAVVLFLIRVVPYGHDFDKAMGIVGDGVTWLLIYALAFAGWGIYFGLPILVHRYLANRIQNKMEAVRASQQELIGLWGRDVATAGSGKTVGD